MASIEIIPDSVRIERMSDERYFSEEFKDYISNSKLSLLNPEEDGSIEKLNTGFKQDYSSSYELGSAVHCMVLQENDFYISELRKPTGKFGMFLEEFYKLRKKGYKISDAVTKASIVQNYYSDKILNNEKRFKKVVEEGLSFHLTKVHLREEDKSDKIPIYLSQKMSDQFMNCYSSLSNHSEASRLLKPKGLFESPEIYNEYAIFCDLEVITDDGQIEILKFKGKLDNFTIDNEEKIITLNDLKTSGKPVKSFKTRSYTSYEGKKVEVEGSYFKYHYYRQMAIYMYLLGAALNKKGYKMKGNMIVVETLPVYDTMVYKVTSEEIQKGLQEFKTLLLYYVYSKLS